jgi:hypothetical protein
MERLSPTGEPAAPEQVGLALRAIAAGTLAGLGTVSGGLCLMRLLQRYGAAPRAPSPDDLVADLVLLSWLGGAALGAVLAWSIMAPILSAYRRGGFAMVSGFGTLVVALGTAPVDQLLGPWGLLGLAVASFLLAAIMRRRAMTVA